MIKERVFIQRNSRKSHSFSSCVRLNCHASIIYVRLYCNANSKLYPCEKLRIIYQSIIITINPCTHHKLSTMKSRIMYFAFFVFASILIFYWSSKLASHLQDKHSGMEILILLNREYQLYAVK